MFEVAFIDLPVGQGKPENNLPEAISACLEQALISNPVLFVTSINTLKQTTETNLLGLVERRLKSEPRRC